MKEIGCIGLSPGGQYFVETIDVEVDCIVRRQVHISDYGEDIYLSEAEARELILILNKALS